MSKLNIGQCGICERKIWDDVKDSKGNVISRKPNSEYAEFSLMLSDGSHARTSVCATCFPNITTAQAKALLVRIKETWLDEMVGWATGKQFARIKSLSLVTWDHEEKKSIEKFKKIKKIEHAEKVKIKKVK